MDLCNDGIVFALVFPKRSYWWSEITTCTCRHLWTCNSLIATAWNFTLFCKYTVRRLQPLPMTSLASLASVVMSCTVPHASWWQKFNKFLIILTRMTPSGIHTHTHNSQLILIRPILVRPGHVFLLLGGRQLAPLRPCFPQDVGDFMPRRHQHPEPWQCYWLHGMNEAPSHPIITNGVPSNECIYIYSYYICSYYIYICIYIITIYICIYI